MDNDILARLPGLADAELVNRMKALIALERGASAELIAHIAELDTRDLHLREGYSSLFVYCRDALGLSDWEAYNRIEVARAVRRFAPILGLLADGSLNLTAVRLLAPHLTPENHTEVLHSARWKRKFEIEEIAARLSPRPEVSLTVRRIRRSPTLTAAELVPAQAATAVSSPAPDDPVRAAPSVAPSGAEAVAVTTQIPTVVTPLAPDRYKLQVTITGEVLERLRLAKDMLGHAIPSGDDAAVIDRALRALLTELARRRFGSTPRPRCSSVSRPPRPSVEAKISKPAPRNPSAAVKRSVWVRDLGRCAFIGKGGHRCNERRFVEFHHVDPYALGGEATVEKVELRCRRHNDYEARLYFGRRWRAGRETGDGELVLEQVGLSALDSTS